jgi:ubiquinone/menaquinone biosynthesis C-methylase UbiE
MNTPTKRSELAKMVPPGATVIELGVAAGRFAVQLIEANPAISYLGIDRWSDHHDDAEYHRAKEVIEVMGGSVLRSTFEDARPQFEDSSAHLVYVDGYAHTGQDGGKTLKQWWTVVQPGGIFAGHDYHPEYQPTIDAVDAFVAAHKLTLHIIDEAHYASWWVRKP